MLRTSIAGLLAWLLPGAGHIYLGHRRRGLIFLIVIAATFWSGVAMGGVSKTVDPKNRTAWFMAQISTGAHALVVLGWRGARGDVPPIYSFQADDVGVVYSGVAGLLNLLVILDALARAESPDPTAARARERMA